jgi:DNA helicase-2/ATP-dependent DNA helicase PcrA
MDFAQRQGDARAPAFLEELRRRQVATRARPGARGAPKALALATVQSAKGREWQHVLLPYIEEGQFPRATRNGEEFAEERRYLYVAVSRAIAGLSLFEPTAPERRSRLLAVN